MKFEWIKYLRLYRKVMSANLIGLVFFCSPVFGAQLCQPQLHNDIVIEAESLLFRDQQNRFRIGPSGHLYFDVHRVDLDEIQRASLTQYNQTIRHDVPYLRQVLTQELTTAWRALDEVIVAELGKQSSLGSELHQYYQHLNIRMEDALMSADKMPVFDHQALLNVVAELRASLPLFIQMITIRGLQDVARLSEGQESKLQFISTKMGALQDKLTQEITLQRQRVQVLHQDVCQRLSDWQAQEKIISSLIPALSNWKTVTIRD